MMGKKFIYDHGCTHAGIFHADDVYATAFLKILNPQFVVERVFQVPEQYDGIIYDIGLGEFDHHQKENEVRENGIPYAAFGKLWRAYAQDLGLTQDSLDNIEEELVQPLDAADNGGAGNPLSLLISSMNPVWDSMESTELKFEQAVEKARDDLNHVIERERSRERAREIVMEAVSHMNENGVVVLERFVPAVEILKKEVPKANFVVFPSNRGGWNIRTVPIEENPRKGRVPFPEQWLGNPDKNLGMTFCHPGNFLATTQTKEQAVNVANNAVIMFGERLNIESVAVTDSNIIL